MSVMTLRCLFVAEGEGEGEAERGRGGVGN